MNLEDELRSAFRRENPSPGFAEQAIAKARFSARPKVSNHRAIWAAAIAAMLVIGFGAAAEYRQMKAERAGREVVLALRITADKLNMTRDKLLQRGEN